MPALFTSKVPRLGRGGRVWEEQVGSSLPIGAAAAWPAAQTVCAARWGTLGRRAAVPRSGAVLWGAPPSAPLG